MMKCVISYSALTVILLLWACATASPPLAIDPGASSSAASYNAEGIKHYQMGHWDIAQQHFQAAVEAEPELAQSHYNLALALHQLGSHEEATVHFKKAAELAPNNTAITGSGVYWNHVAPPRSYLGGYY